MVTKLLKQIFSSDTMLKYTSESELRSIDFTSLPFCKSYLDKDPKLYIAGSDWFRVSLYDSKGTRYTVAFVCFNENHPELDSVHISVIEILEKLRGHGIMTKIMDLIKANAKKAGYKNISLQVFKPSLIGMYQRYGFEIVNTDETLKNPEFYKEHPFMIFHL